MKLRCSLMRLCSMFRQRNSHCEQANECVAYTQLDRHSWCCRNHKPTDVSDHKAKTKNEVSNFFARTRFVCLQSYCITLHVEIPLQLIFVKDIRALSLKQAICRMRFDEWKCATCDVHKGQCSEQIDRMTWDDLKWFEMMRKNGCECPPANKTGFVIRKSIAFGPVITLR